MECHRLGCYTHRDDGVNNGVMDGMGQTLLRSEFKHGAVDEGDRQLAMGKKRRRGSKSTMTLKIMTTNFQPSFMILILLAPP